jgi:hypothetical protein
MPSKESVIKVAFNGQFPASLLNAVVADDDATLCGCIISRAINLRTLALDKFQLYANVPRKSSNCLMSFLIFYGQPHAACDINLLILLVKNSL